MEWMSRKKLNTKAPNLFGQDKTYAHQRHQEIVQAMLPLFYFFYSYVIILTNIDGVSTLAKMGITAACNFVGVLAVKWVEELARKEKLWKIEMTVPTKYRAAVDFDLREVPHSYIEISDKHTLFNFYCATQAESKKVKDIVAQYDAKYFVAESKNL